MDQVELSVIHVVIAVALDADQEGETRLVGRHRLIQRLKIAVGRAVGLVRPIAVGFLGREIVLEVHLVKAEVEPGRVAPIVRVCVGVSGQRRVAKVLQIADNAVGVIEVEPVEGGDARHQHHRVGCQHLILARIGPAADMRADGVTIDAVRGVFDDAEHVLVGAGIGDKVKVIQAFGKDQHHIGVFLFRNRLHCRGVVRRAGRRLRGRLIGIIIRFDNRVHQQTGRFDRAGQVPVCIVGCLPGPAIGLLGLDGKRREVADIEDGKNARRTAGPAAKPARPANLALFRAGKPALHRSNGRNRHQAERNGLYCGSDAQRVAAHHGGGRRDVEHILRHERGAVQVAGIIVRNGQHREQNPRDAGGQPPPPAQRKEQQGYAKSREGVERRVQRPLPGQIIRRNAVRYFKLVPRDESRRDRKRERQELPQPKIPAAQRFEQVLHGFPSFFLGAPQKARCPVPFAQTGALRAPLRFRAPFALFRQMAGTAIRCGPNLSSVSLQFSQHAASEHFIIAQICVETRGAPPKPAQPLRRIKSALAGMPYCR